LLARETEEQSWCCAAPFLSEEVLFSALHREMILFFCIGSSSSSMGQ
jgi:hypothetical protein